MTAMTSNTVLQVLVLGDEGSKLDTQGINRKLQGAYKDTDRSQLRDTVICAKLQADLP